jgi:hypothetical protein
MGLIAGLLLLPLAPVRGTVWVAERLAEQAQSEMQDESSIHTALQELEAARDAGEIDDQQLAEAEDELLNHLLAVRGEESHGRIQ